MHLFRQMRRKFRNCRTYYTVNIKSSCPWKPSHNTVWLLPVIVYPDGNWLSIDRRMRTLCLPRIQHRFYLPSASVVFDPLHWGIWLHQFFCFFFFSWWLEPDNTMNFIYACEVNMSPSLENMVISFLGYQICQSSEHSHLHGTISSVYRSPSPS